MKRPAPHKETKLFLTRTIPASRWEVFKAWTDPEEIRKWFAPGSMDALEASVDLRVGGHYRIVMRNASEKTSQAAVGVYREIKAPERLVFTWSWEGDHSGEMLVTLEFRDKGGQTELTLLHEFFPNEESRNIHNEGWIGCLDKLDSYLTI